ncbi:MAG: RNA polymerase sigma factor [Ginsengibacter sp.]
MTYQKDILIWNGMRAGNQKDLHAIYTDSYNDLLRYGIYLTADILLAKDHINVLFVRLWNTRDKLPEVKNPKAYLITCYKNELLFRKKKAGIALMFPQSSSDLDFVSTASVEDTIIELQEYEILKMRVKHLLNSLSDRQRLLIQLRFIEEMSYEEIAMQEGISVRTVYNSIHESLKLLRVNNSKLQFQMFFSLLL